jgi:hypothetical protein
VATVRKIYGKNVENDSKCCCELTQSWTPRASVVAYVIPVYIPATSPAIHVHVEREIRELHKILLTFILGYGKLPAINLNAT